MTNNNASNTTEIPPEADLEIIKLVSNATVHKGDKVIWTVVVTNNGPDVAVNVVVTEKLPVGLVYVSDDSEGAYNSLTGIWNAGDIAKDGNATLNIVTLVDVTNGTVVNLVNTSSDTYDPDMTNNNATNGTVVPPEADLEAIITNNFEGSEVPCHNGDTVVWTITVINHGPDTAVNATLKDLLPPNCIYVSDDSEGAYNNVTAIWSIGDLPVGESVTLKITTVANTTNDTIFRNVSVSSETYDPDLSNNKDDSSIIVPPEADVEVVKVVSNSTPHKGDEITWAITVYNRGPDTAINTTVMDKLPKGLVYVSDDSFNQYDPKTGIWNVGDLDSGDCKTIWIVTKVSTTNKSIVNIAEGYSDTYDPDETNNVDNDTANVPPEADLVITVVPDVTEIFVGDKVAYTITVVNKGPDTAVNSFATIEVPDELKVLGFKPSKGTYDPESGIWIIGDLAPGEKVTLMLNTEALVSGTIIVKASVECDTYETDLTNNNDSAEILVKELPNPEKHIPTSEKMYATGNPIAIVLLALFAIVVVNIRKRN